MEITFVISDTQSAAHSTVFVILWEPVAQRGLNKAYQSLLSRCTASEVAGSVAHR